MSLAATALLVALGAGAALAAWRQPGEAPQSAGAGNDGRTVEAEDHADSQVEGAAGEREDGEPHGIERRGGGARRDGRGPRRDRPSSGPPSDEEWRAAAASMKALAPNAWARFLEIPENAPFRPSFQRGIVDRYQELARLKERNVEQYAGEIKQIQIEDEIFGIAARLRGAQGATSEELKKHLQEKVGELIDLRIGNRERRIARLAERLDQERKKLEADKKNKASTVKKKYDAIVDRSVSGGGLFANPGGTARPRPGGRQQKPARAPSPDQQRPGREAPGTPSQPPPEDREAPPADLP